MLSDPENKKLRENQDISDLYSSRAKYSGVSLFLLVSISILLLTSSLSIISLFNLPAIAGLLTSLYFQKRDSLRAQKYLKLAIKVGVAKAIGAMLLASLLYYKYHLIPLRDDFSSNLTEPLNIKIVYTYLIVLSAIVDLVYVILSRPILRRTKAMLRILKNQKRSVLIYSELKNSESMSPKIKSP